MFHHGEQAKSCGIYTDTMDNNTRIKANGMDSGKSTSVGTMDITRVDFVRVEMAAQNLLGSFSICAIAIKQT
jgi:hypothetical protein